MDAVAERRSADFQQFLKEINDHFVHVVGERLGWTVLERPSWTEGNGNVVLRFRTPQGLFIFRVPKHSQFQLRSVALAYRHFGHLGLMPEVVYRDGKCVLERFMPGLPLSSDSSDATLQALGQRLAALHHLPATGFGRLSHGVSGWFDDATTWLAENPGTVHTGRRHAQDDAGLDPEQRELADALARRIAEAPTGLHAAPVRVCHGDLWRSNVIVGPDGALTLIDWDMLGAYPCEVDLVVMVDADLDARQKALVLEAYGRPVDMALAHWIALRRIAQNPRASLRDKLDKALRHQLLG